MSRKYIKKETEYKKQFTNEEGYLYTMKLYAWASVLIGLIAALLGSEWWAFYFLLIQPVLGMLIEQMVCNIQYKLETKEYIECDELDE